MDYRTFFVDVQEGELDNIAQIIEKPSRNIAKFFICFEGTNKQGKDKPHYHVLTYAERKDHLSLFAFIKEHYGLVEKQKELRKKNPRGGIALYGSPKKKETVDTYEHFLTYLCKEQKDPKKMNYRSKGIDDATIQNCLNDSYKDVETVKKLELQQLFKHIDNHYKFIHLNRYEHECRIENMKHCIITIIIDWLFEHKDSIQLSTLPTSIKSYFYKYLRTSTELNMYYRINITKERVLSMI